MATPPNFTDRQLRVYLALQRNRMAWIAFAVVMTMFVIVFGLFIYATFIRHDVDAWVQSGLAILDGLLGWTVRHIIGYLFPRPADSDVQTDRVQPRLSPSDRKE